jgi:hypothetical protein
LFTASALEDEVIEPLRPVTVKVVLQEATFRNGTLLFREMEFKFSSTGNGDDWEASKTSDLGTRMYIGWASKASPTPLLHAE